jgi:hypothetical protein
MARNRTWRRHASGWDPTHVESRGLCASLRDGRAMQVKDSIGFP